MLIRDFFLGGTKGEPPNENGCLAESKLMNLVALCHVAGRLPTGPSDLSDWEGCLAVTSKVDRIGLLSWL